MKVFLYISGGIRNQMGAPFNMWLSTTESASYLLSFKISSTVKPNQSNHLLCNRLKVISFRGLTDWAGIHITNCTARFNSKPEPLRLPDIKGNLIGMIFLKEPSISLGHYTFMINVNTIWYLCNDNNVTVIDFNKFCISSSV